MFVSSEFSQFLAEHHFRLCLMPIVNARTGEADKHEALLRSDDPTIQIEQFVIQCEKQGQIGTISRPKEDQPDVSEIVPVKGDVGMLDQLTITAALDYLRRDPEAKSLSVNMSGITAGSSQGIQIIQKAAADYPDAAKRLTIEVTETAGRTSALSRAFVQRAHRAGIKVMVDDVGDSCGCAKLSHSLIYMTDGIKVCAHALHGVEKLSASFREQIAYAKKWDRTIVVEGIEDPEQKQLWMSQMGGAPTHWQGYSLGHAPDRADIFLIDRREQLRPAA